MQRQAPSALLAPLFALAVATGLAALPAPAAAQAQRAYAPEQLWTLDPRDQTRVISQEYREQSGGRAIPGDQLRFYLDQVRLSRWTFSKVRQDIATSLSAAPAPGNPGDPGSQAIRCESNDGRQRTCNTPWSGRSSLSRQLSSARCTQGQTWFTSAGRVTVSQGCRGEFVAASVIGGGNRQTSLQCESNDGRLRTCGANVIGRAQLQRQLSSQRCIENRNFGVRNRSLWVNGGCRGVFLVRTSTDNGRPHRDDYAVTCSSDNGRRQTCAWDARRGAPVLVQQLSRDACRNGYSWGYSARAGLWVNHGCRARFGTR